MGGLSRSVFEERFEINGFGWFLVFVWHFLQWRRRVYEELEC